MTAELLGLASLLAEAECSAYPGLSRVCWGFLSGLAAGVGFSEPESTWKVAEGNGGAVVGGIPAFLLPCPFLSVT